LLTGVGGVVGVVEGFHEGRQGFGWDECMLYLQTDSEHASVENGRQRSC
jgi:hypothetical protein